MFFDLRIRKSRFPHIEKLIFVFRRLWAEKKILADIAALILVWCKCTLRKKNCKKCLRPILGSVPETLIGCLQIRFSHDCLFLRAVEEQSCLGQRQIHNWTWKLERPIKQTDKRRRDRASEAGVHRSFVRASHATQCVRTSYHLPQIGTNLHP